MRAKRVLFDKGAGELEVEGDLNELGRGGAGPGVKEEALDGEDLVLYVFLNLLYLGWCEGFWLSHRCRAEGESTSSGFGSGLAERSRARRCVGVM